MNEQSLTALAKTLLDGVAAPDSSLKILNRSIGRSGAHLVHVVAGVRRFVLKLDAPEHSLERWRATLAIQRAAAERDVAPAVVAWNEESRAVLSEYIEDTSLFAALFDPDRIDGALMSLVRALASLHALDPSLSSHDPSPIDRCRTMLNQLPFAVPSFAGDAWNDFIQRDASYREDTLCHLDLNPSNLIFDGRRVWLIDWDTAGRGDRWVDLASLVHMLLLPPERGTWLLEQYGSASGAEPPSAETFADARRLVAVGYGCAFLALVGRPPKLDGPPKLSLAECYGALQEGRLSMDDDAGRWTLAAAYFADYWTVR